MLAIPRPPPLRTTSTTEAPRKRRRKTPAGGASSDCHRCQERNGSCDRRRPYCSQCLEIGNECSGYKTQLTWGVGVASRGKLRGLSLPVARSAPATKDDKVTRPTYKRTQSLSATLTSSTSVVADVETKENDQPPPAIRRASSYSTSKRCDGKELRTALQAPSLGSNWLAMIDEEPSTLFVDSSSPVHQLFGPPMLKHPDRTLSNASIECTPFFSPDTGLPEDQMYMSAQVSSCESQEPHIHDSVSRFSFSAQHLPVSHSYVAIDAECPLSEHPLHANCEPASSQTTQYHTLLRAGEHAPIGGSFDDCYDSSLALYDDDMSVMSTIYGTETQFSNLHRQSIWSTHENDYISLSSLPHDPLTFSPPEFDYPSLDFVQPVPAADAISPRLAFYLSYYENAICPTMAAIDTPNNPYRQDVLLLAGDSEGLQHAICALAACHLRLRRRQRTTDRVCAQQRKHGRQDPFDVCFHRTEDCQPKHDYMSASPPDEVTIAEEHHHRNVAVNLLNSSLSSPDLACHDSVLATLFILCHYRMCESGIGQFKTQFTGAKKLMGMRSVGIETRQWGWMETAFTFFDALSATVNEREAQLRGGYVDMIAEPQCPEHALENQAGLDGKLFKIIVHLGRLNLLSQEASVLPLMRNCVPLPAPPVKSARPRLSGTALANYYHDNPTHFDGNGFATTLDDVYDYTSVDTGSSRTDEDDTRYQFWYEWESVRQALETWSFDRQALHRNLPSDSPRIPESGIRDFNLVSEAFRYAALLYTERLAVPSAPSRSQNLQQYVLQTLNFVRGLSDGTRLEKFILWPVFVAGSEACEEGQRELVRRLCKSICARSGYSNNSSALEVLEKIWIEIDSEGVEGMAGSGNGKHPFKWTKHMAAMDGELIIV